MIFAMERISKILGENDPSLFQPPCYEAPSTGHPHLKPCLGEGHQVQASPFMFWLHWPLSTCVLCFFPLLVSHNVVNGTKRTYSPTPTCVFPPAERGQQIAGPMAGCLGYKGISTCPHTEHTGPFLLCESAGIS